MVIVSLCARIDNRSYAMNAKYPGYSMFNQFVLLSTRCNRKNKRSTVIVIKNVNKHLSQMYCSSSFVIIKVLTYKVNLI